MSRREDQISAGGKRAKGQNMISQGEGLIRQGESEDPGELNWVSFLINPFATSDYHDEQFKKGLIYLGTAGGLVIAGAATSHWIEACMSVSLLLAAIPGLLGICHVQASGGNEEG